LTAAVVIHAQILEFAVHCLQEHQETAETILAQRLDVLHTHIAVDHLAHKLLPSIK
jgi:hypothetical protein